MSTATKIGLRVDVDTYRGTRDGVPKLLEILAEHHILATFFFSVGPDNMGRHLWRLLKPAFLFKMLRSNAAGLYGWDILLRGTFWPGRHIGRHLGDIFNRTRDAGHEVGLHAWDHHKWQKRVEKMSTQEIRGEIEKGFNALQEITSSRPDCSAAAGWKCAERVLLEKEVFGFRYNSDCRGDSIFRPRIDNHVCIPQIPVTLPTYDELIGRNGIDNRTYNDALLNMIKPGQLNVLTIHAEVEGIVCSGLFEDFLTHAIERNIVFVPLGNLLPAQVDTIPPGGIGTGTLPGREGSVCMQRRE
jgi:undecaprenyl phosphate-alpha-L-ara4FN deformylase